MRAHRASPNEGLPRTAAGATADFSSHTAPPPLTPKALEEFLDGGFSEAAVVKQVTNGKNAMPAFGGRLSDSDIANVATYVISTAKDGWD